MRYYTGIGYDIHRLVEERKLFIGGIEIPYFKGSFGHSDGDVLLHALCDAFLGAIGEGDIGEHFPDSDPKYSNISSTVLLKKVNELIKSRNLTINNIDTVIIAQEPALSPFKKKIKEKIAEVLEINPQMINIKAKTNEGLGEIGRKGAIASWAIISLKQEEKR